MSLWKKRYPRAKPRCKRCDTTRWGLARPNFPYCSPVCKAADKPPDQFELPLHKPPDAPAP